MSQTAGWLKYWVGLLLALVSGCTPIRVSDVRHPGQKDFAPPGSKDGSHHLANRRPDPVPPGYFSGNGYTEYPPGQKTAPSPTLLPVPDHLPPGHYSETGPPDSRVQGEDFPPSVSPYSPRPSQTSSLIPEDFSPQGGLLRQSSFLLQSPFDNALPNPGPSGLKDADSSAQWVSTGWSPPGLNDAPTREPLVLALEKFLENKPAEAIDHLKVYEPDNQEFYLRILPVVALLRGKKLDQLTQQDAKALHDQLDGLVMALRCRADLLIDRMCCCDTIEGLGEFKELPEEYAFRASDGKNPGERVQLYVQLRNLSFEKKGSLYYSRLASSVEITDAQGKKWWYWDFQDREKPIVSQTLRRDHFNNYTFFVPRLPEGNYLLTIQIRDITSSGQGRLARKTIPFRLAS